MAEITVSELVTKVTTLLRAALTEPVEEYWRPIAPSVVTVYVHPTSVSEEEGIHLTNLSGGVHFWREQVQIIIEGPWEDDVESFQAVNTVAETVRATIQANRDLTVGSNTAADGKYMGHDYKFIERPNVKHAQNWSAWVTASWRV